MKWETVQATFIVCCTVVICFLMFTVKSCHIEELKLEKKIIKAAKEIKTLPKKVENEPSK